MIEDVTVQKGCNAVIYLGNVKVESVSVNGNQLTAEQYEVRNYMLTIYADALTQTENEVNINGEHTITVTLE